MNLYTRPPIERFARIVAFLAARRHSVVSQERIAEELGCSRKTIDRDVTFMRDRLQIPIEVTSGWPNRGTRLVGEVELCPVCQRAVEGRP